MPTIGRRHAGRRRDTTSFCDICGVAWLRSELTGPDDDGYFRCPDDADGRATKELDYQRAINASEVQTIQGADQPGQAPAFEQLVGWGWVQTGTADRIGGNLQIVRTDRGVDSLYTVTGAHYHTLEVHPYDLGDPAQNIAREYVASSWDGDIFLDRPGATNTVLDPLGSPANGYSTGRIIGANRVSDFDDAPDGVNAGPGGFVVFAYAYTGGEGILTEVASAWVNGATGEAYSSSGPITTARTSAGIYTATLTAGTHTVAQVSRYTSADPETVLRAWIWGGRTSTTVTKVRCVNAAAAPLDSDFMIRMYL